jgi:putative transposase
LARVAYGRGYAYSIQYHIVWCVKYRRKIITPVVECTLSNLIRKIVAQNDFSLEEFNCDLDRVHLLVSCTPQHYIPNMLKALKGVSARLLLKAHPEIRSQLWGGHVWNPSYFIATVSENTEEQIRHYIQGQKER